MEGENENKYNLSYWINFLPLTRTMCAHRGGAVLGHCSEAERSPVLALAEEHTGVLHS